MAKFYAIAPNGDSAVLSISLQNMDQSLQQNGWCKLPNGLIIQWGLSNITTKPLGEGFDIITFPTKFPTGAMSCGCSTIGAWVCHADGGSCIYGATPVEPYQGGQNHFLIGMARSDNAMVQVAFHWHVTGY